MKKVNMLVAAVATALLVGSCGSSDAPVETVSYTLDTENSSLKWKGSMNPEYFHIGTVSFTEGAIEMADDKLTAGSFTLDMNAISIDDAELPEDKKGYLATHLKDTSFFFIAEHPTVTVTVNGYENGKLATVISVLGQDIKQEIPVKMVQKEGVVTIQGKFDIDFEALKMAGMAPDPKTGDKVQSVVSYELDLTLNKKK
jgi:polyisoprenoid-binding protein YceI